MTARCASTRTCPRRWRNGTAADAEEWRIHFHTPLFVDSYGDLRLDARLDRRTFVEAKRRRNCRILEIETYTWDVLPREYKQDLTESIAREYEWVLHARLPATAQASTSSAQSALHPPRQDSSAPG